MATHFIGFGDFGLKIVSGKFATLGLKIGVYRKACVETKQSHEDAGSIGLNRRREYFPILHLWGMYLSYCNY